MDKHTLGHEYTEQGWSPEVPFEDAPGMIVMSMLTGHGDLKKIWNAANADEVDDAKRSFEHMTKVKKYVAFRVKEDGTPGEQLREFDPTAGKMILVPAMAGG